LQDGGESSLVSKKSIFSKFQKIFRSLSLKYVRRFFFKMADKFKNGMIQIADPNTENLLEYEIIMHRLEEL
jgi:hypothetical protein